MVSTDIRVLWTGTAATIPANWSRDTDFDEKFLQVGDETFEICENGGGSHTHTVDNHSHSGGSHVHSIESSTATGSMNSAQTNKAYPIAAPTIVHHHRTFDSAAATVTTATDGSETTDAQNMQPPYVKAILIKPDDSSQEIPDDAICFTDEIAAPTGYHATDGLGGTTDYNGKFVLGADAAGNGGGTGGSATHTHQSTSHYHDLNDHVHTAVSTAGLTGSTNVRTPISTPVTVPDDNFHHTVGLQSGGPALTTTSQPFSGTASNEPAYVQLLGIQNTSGSASTPIGVVVIYVGAADSLPSGWVLMDGSGDTTDCRNKQIKITKTGGDIGNTGGADSHNHTFSHSHNLNAHTHTEYENDTAGTQNVQATGTMVFKDAANHTHSYTVNNSALTALSTEDPETNLSDGRDAYRTCVLIKKIREKTVSIGTVYKTSKIVLAG